MCPTLVRCRLAGKRYIWELQNAEIPTKEITKAVRLDNSEFLLCGLWWQRNLLTFHCQTRPDLFINANNVSSKLNRSIGTYWAGKYSLIFSTALVSPSSHLSPHAGHVIELSWVHVRCRKHGAPRSRCHPAASRQAGRRLMKTSNNSPRSSDE